MQSEDRCKKPGRDDIIEESVYSQEHTTSLRDVFKNGKQIRSVGTSYALNGHCVTIIETTIIARTDY